MLYVDYTSIKIYSITFWIILEPQIKLINIKYNFEVSKEYLEESMKKIFLTYFHHKEAPVT